MNIFQYEFPDILIKVSNKREYLEDLCNGKVYMNASGYFRKLEDTYRGDKFDGRCYISFENHKGEFLEFGPEDSPEERLKIPIENIRDFTVGFVNDDKIPIYCCSQLSENILRKETETSLTLKEDFISEMKKFGNYYMLFSKAEFMENMLEFINANQLGGEWGPISYTDIRSEHFIELLNDNSRNQYDAFFKKDLTYRWQNEWRILLVSNEVPLIEQSDDHYVANIAPLSWFHIGNISELYTNSIQITEKEEAELDEDILTN